MAPRTARQEARKTGGKAAQGLTGTPCGAHSWPMNRPPEPSAPEVVSPCISVCCLDPETGNCLGCWRTPKEIRDWPNADSAERLAILEHLHERRRAAGKTNARDARPRRRRRAASAP
ncbi:MAG: DUF1289 domain-containing protein [Rhodospirillales bacterium]